MRLILSFAAMLLLIVTSAQARPVEFAAAVPDGAALVVPLRSEAEVGQRAGDLEPEVRDALIRALRSTQFDYKTGSALALRGIGRHPLIVIAGIGPSDQDGATIANAGGGAAVETAAHPGPVALMAAGLSGPDASALALGAALRSYRFDRYQSADPAKPRDPRLDAPLVVVGAAPEAASQFNRDGAAQVRATAFVRDLVNEPANILYPEIFVDRARAAFAGQPNVRIEVLDVTAMERLGMGSILSVGQGSRRPPRLLAVHYQGAAGAPLALVGKGITFDSGGTSLKPGTGMWRMKGDMAGAATVVGAALSLAASRAPVNVVAIAALAENMPGGGATRPGDVVRAMTGKTIEIINTDAEGRLVLADAVAFAERQYRPFAIVDVATLTGAKVGALGDDYAALFSRDEGLAAALLNAGQHTGELLWRLPLHSSYANDMKSPVADLRNVVEGGGPGAGLGAHFIGAFVSTTPWAHLDIAANEMADSASALSPEGATGFGIRLLDRFARDYRPAAR